MNFKRIDKYILFFNLNIQLLLISYYSCKKAIPLGHAKFIYNIII
jgi:hypothetical protein